MTRSNSILSASIVGLALGAACPYSYATDHCANADGDAYCAEAYPDGARAFCARGLDECGEQAASDGCVDARPQDDACYSPCGGGKSLAEDPECEGAAEGTSSSDTVTVTDATTEPTGDATTAASGSMSMGSTDSDTDSTATTSTGCASSDECIDPDTPVCVDMACVPCTVDAQCEAKDAGAPACRADGQCVACTPNNPSACVDATPVCNAATSECEGCSFHAQCDSTACDIATGACFSDACVVEVDGDGGADYTDIQDAVMDGCVVVVHELGGGDSYSQVEVTGIDVALLAAPGEQPLVVGLAGNPSLTVGAGAVAYVQGLIFTDSDVEGVAVSAATLYLDETAVIDNTGGGVVLTSNAEGFLRNCFVGGDVSDVAAVRTMNASVEVLYSTLAAGFGTAAGLRCNGSGTVDVRNSLVVARTDDAEIDCATDSLVSTVSEAELGDMNTNWFAGFSIGNFHLSGSAPAEISTAAQWQQGDPAVDIDGDLRPSEAGATDVAGADRP